MLEQAVPQGAGIAVHSEDGGTFNWSSNGSQATCTWSFTNDIIFTGDAKTVMYGAFVTSEYNSCAAEYNRSASYNVKFTVK